jgi:alpha-D-ribose 1-methylphosphonate 5-triphosphate synthase subunit PhnH
LATLQQSVAMLAQVGEAQVGTLLYPDQAATIVVGCKLGVGTSMRLRGPGIAGVTTLSIGGLPSAFWQLRAERIVYPLGWDLFLLDGDLVAGLPRSTLIESENLEGGK